MTTQSKHNVVGAMRRLKDFVYLSERQENEMGFSSREFRPLAKMPIADNLGKKSHYLGQWRIGEDIVEGRGVLFAGNG